MPPVDLHEDYLAHRSNLHNNFFFAKLNFSQHKLYYKASSIIRAGTYKSLIRGRKRWFLSWERWEGGCYIVLNWYSGSMILGLDSIKLVWFILIHVVCGVDPIGVFFYAATLVRCFTVCDCLQCFCCFFFTLSMNDLH